MLKIIELPLRLDVEGAEGFDLVAEEFDADGIEGIGGKEIDDAAVHAELAGGFQSGHAVEATLDQPIQKFSGIDFLADGERAGAGEAFLSRRDGLQKGGDARHHDRRRVGGFQRTQHAQPRPEHDIADIVLLRQRFPGGENRGGDAGEVRHVEGEVVHLLNRGQDDKQRPARRPRSHECGSRQRAGRAPGSIDGGVLSGFKSLRHAAEVVPLVKQGHQIP